MRQRTFASGGWLSWFWWPSADEPTTRAKMRSAHHSEGTAPAPLPEQDPALPLYHDANLW